MNFPEMLTCSLPCLTSLSIFLPLLTLIYFINTLAKCSDTHYIHKATNIKQNTLIILHNIQIKRVSVHLISSLWSALSGFRERKVKQVHAKPLSPGIKKEKRWDCVKSYWS